MTTHRWLSMTGLLGGAMLIAAACSSSTSPGASVLGASFAPVPTSAPVVASIDIGSANDPTLGAYLTGANGRTLYVFTDDTSGQSTCRAQCAEIWPPLILAAGATITGPSGATGTFSLITRFDGSMQAAYNGMPLYYYSGDSASGQTTGQGSNGRWFVAPLSGVRPSPAAGSSAGAGSY
jgi:predicted lipoprotein with Yx(FWY)xxD motif